MLGRLLLIVGWVFVFGFFFFLDIAILNLSKYRTTYFSEDISGHSV